MDIVYALGKGSRMKDIELRFSLRSIEKYLTGFGKVVIVGERPDWLQNISWVPLSDDPRLSPDHNIMLKVAGACRQSEISEDFLFFNDDHFLISPFHVEHFPAFYQGDLATYCRLRGLDGYGKRAKSTLDYLKSKDLPIKYFDVHTPILYNKALFLDQVAAAPGWSGEGYIIKSLYANSLQLDGEPFRDQKINAPPVPDVKIFSTFPHIKASVTRFLSETFPEMSRFERTDI